MLIIIDGYNLLKMVSPTKSINDRQRAEFIARLEAYAKSKDHRIVLVFDGGDNHWPEKGTRGRVTTIYSGYRMKADDIIKRLMPTLYPSSSLLVTSDRQLTNYAATFEIPIMDSHEFNDYIMSYKATEQLRVIKDKSKPLKQEGHQSTSDIDALMQEASRVILNKDVGLQAEETGKKKKSKHEKKLDNIAKKL